MIPSRLGNPSPVEPVSSLGHLVSRSSKSYALESGHTSRPRDLLSKCVISLPCCADRCLASDGHGRLILGWWNCMGSRGLSGAVDRHGNLPISDIRSRRWGDVSQRSEFNEASRVLGAAGKGSVIVSLTSFAESRAETFGYGG